MVRRPFREMSKMISTMDYLQDSIKAAGIEEGPEVAFAWSNQYLEYAQIKELNKEVNRSIIFSLCAVFLVCLAVTFSLTTSLLLLFLVLCMYLELFLLMWVLDMRINAVTVTCTILAAGFAIDYCLHIATATVGAEEAGSWADRVQVALERMGAAVFNGGTTTLLASCGLALGSSGIMQNMFKMMMVSLNPVYNSTGVDI